MKLTLDRIDTRGLTLVPPGAKGDVIGIASTTNLRGTVVAGGGALAVRDASVDEIVLASLRLTLGSLVLVAPAGATLRGVAVGVEQSQDTLSLDVTASSLDAPDLTIVVDGVSVRGRALLEGVRLVVRGDAGSIATENLDVRSLALRLDDTDVRTDAARGSQVAIGWGGADGFRLDAGTLDAPALLVALPGLKVAASGVAVGAVALRGPEIAVGRASLDTTRVELDLSADPARGPPAPNDAPREPLVDWRLLDGLTGKIDVDVAVDLKVPILGRRNATHELRVPIEKGTIDYRELERNLSALEDAILDFSVRENALVLERVNPLLPLRGHGKPIVAWTLEGDDLALAERDRVRLSVLPGVAVVATDEEPSDEPSPVALQMLRLLNLRARLALDGAPADAIGGSLRLARVGSLELDGHVHYDPGAAAPPGTLRGRARDLAACLYQLALDEESILDVAELAIGAVSSVEIDFADVAPTAVRVEVTTVTTSGIAVKPRSGVRSP